MRWKADFQGYIMAYLRLFVRLFVLVQKSLQQRSRNILAHFPRTATLVSQERLQVSRPHKVRQEATAMGYCLMLLVYALVWLGLVVLQDTPLPPVVLSVWPISPPFLVQFGRVEGIRDTSGAAHFMSL